MGNACYGPRQAGEDQNTEDIDKNENKNVIDVNNKTDTIIEEKNESDNDDSNDDENNSLIKSNNGNKTSKKPKIAASTLKHLATGATFTKYSEKSGKAHRRDFFIRQEDKERDIAVTGLLVWAKKGKRQQKDPRATIKLMNLTSISSDKSHSAWEQGDAANADETKAITFFYTAQYKGQQQQKVALFEADTTQERDLWADSLRTLMERRDFIQANQQS
jgi:hypothetical protein